MRSKQYVANNQLKRYKNLLNVDITIENPSSDHDADNGVFRK